ncbi:ROK family transcriptional regulator [Streptomyces sp. BV286]|uniref:ROK family transcriptional regulator n=1 Tax=Streptomyces sp. BV286 TaxID=2849672 RepID=UPI001C2DF462|nr:ROK family transcriptional regulator [Streptomyces sp. BV286]
MSGSPRTSGTPGSSAAAGLPGAAGANLLALRSHNAALLLDLLRRAGRAGVSRLELAGRTGLTPQAVSKITARLREDGLVTEAGRQASTGGKPRTVLRLVPEAGHAVGLHLDRDELRAVLVDLTGAVVAERRTGLGLGAGAVAVLETVVSEARVLMEGLRAGAATASGPAGAGRSRPAAESTVLGVGVAMPGPLDHTHGVLHRVTGFPEWDGFPLRDALARRLGVPVVLDKDTNAAALGLAVGGVGGVGDEVGSFAYLHLGTGLGAGLVLGGAVHRGARTGAGEFGHQVVQLDGPSCPCGNRGCVEVLCLAAVAGGDIDEAARVLGEGAANLVGLLDIDLVLLGGRTVDAEPERFVRGVGAVLDARARARGRARRDAGNALGDGPGVVPVRGVSGGERVVAEGAAQLLLAPLFGRAEA